MELDKRKRIVNAFLSLLRNILTYVLFFIDKKISIFYRKFYVWKVLSCRENWWLSRNGNLYNPTFQATVYPWDGEWNIARFNMHYSGFHSQKYAKKIAFQKWYREYKAKNLMDLANHKVSKSFIKKFFARYRIAFIILIVFIVILTSILYNSYQFGSKFDKRSKEFDLIFNKKQKDFGSSFNSLKAELGNSHWIVDRKQDNTYDEEMKKYKNAMKDENFSVLSTERKECKSFFREKYKKTIASPFGFELSKTKLNDIEGKLTILKREKNRYLGYNYYIDKKSLPFLEGLHEVCFVVDEEQVLQGVVLVMNAGRFDDMSESLSRKYEIVSRDVPFVGNKSVQFKDDNSLIIIDAPHMSFEMSITYATQKFYDNVRNISDKKAQEKKAQEESIL